jgi:cytochrome c-type biogenesis protein CcmH/NrfG
MGRCFAIGVWLVCGLVFAAAVRLEAQATVHSMESADALFQAQVWENAAQAYKAIVDSDPGNGRAWLRLGSAFQRLERYPEAAAAYGEAARNGVESQRLALAERKAHPCEHQARYRELDFWVGEWDTGESAAPPQ